MPAIFALSNEPLIVFASNFFAIMGLRSLGLMRQSMVETFEFLQCGLGFILIFVGLKMVSLNQVFDGKFPISWAHGIIGAILGLSILVSIGYNRWAAGAGTPAQKA